VIGSVKLEFFEMNDGINENDGYGLILSELDVAADPEQGAIRRNSGHDQCLAGHHLSRIKPITWMRFRLFPHAYEQVSTRSIRRDLNHRCLQHLLEQMT
jgi:hypothetical protein